jgi:hypothetical protein
MPGYLPIQLLGPFAVDESTVRYGSVGFSLRVTEYQIEVGIINDGTADVDVAWAEASYYSPDQRVHSLIHADRLDAHNERLQQARLEPEWHASRDRNPAHVNEHVTELLGQVGLWRVGPGQATEWALIPAEHVRTNALGTLVTEPLLCHIRYAAPYYISVFVPVRIDGEWTSVRLLARVNPVV